MKSPRGREPGNKARLDERAQIMGREPVPGGSPEQSTQRILQEPLSGSSSRMHALWGGGGKEGVGRPESAGIPNALGPSRPPLTEQPCGQRNTEKQRKAEGWRGRRKTLITDGLLTSTFPKDMKKVAARFVLGWDFNKCNNVTKGPAQPSPGSHRGPIKDISLIRSFASPV